MGKLVIFDLDGTLLDTIDDITDSMNLALRDVGLHQLTVDECKYMVGSGADILVRKAIPDQKYFEVVKSKYMQYYEEFQRNKTKPYNHIIDVIKAINDKGIKIAILSNKPHDDAIRVVKHYFDMSLFALVMGKKPNNRIKPAIDGCLEILNNLAINKEDVLYVGDTNVDMETAKNAGFTSVAVTWGFRKREELKDYEYIIDEPLELLDIVEEWK